jgi:hypothetical protein
MSTASIRERLRDAFDPALMQTYARIMLRGYPVPDDLFCPYVPYIFDEYGEMKTKLMVVGQQSKTSITMKDAIERRLLFDQLSVQTKALKNGVETDSAFFHFASNLNERLNGKHDLGWIWENLGKISQGNSLPDDRFRQFNEREFCILYAEIEKVGANVIVFATGPNYDELLLRQVCLNPDPTPNPIEAVPGYDVREMAEIKGLPYRAYRCYHPDHLRYKPNGLESTLDTLCKLISTA